MSDFVILSFLIKNLSHLSFTQLQELVLRHITVQVQAKKLAEAVAFIKLSIG